VSGAVYEDPSAQLLEDAAADSGREGDAEVAGSTGRSRAVAEAFRNAGTWERVTPLEPLLVDADGNAVFNRGDVGFLAGAGGVGKSQVALALSFAVASGSDQFGLRVNGAPAGVVYLSSEDSAAVMHERMKKLAGDSGDWRDRLRLVDLTTPSVGSRDLVRLDAHTGAWVPTRLAEDLAGELRMLANAGKIGLVVVDPGARFLGPDAEIDPRAATAGVEALSRLGAAAGGAAVLCLMHSTKAHRRGEDSSGAIRGSSALHDGARAVFELTSEAPGFARLRHVKSNHTATLSDVYVVWVDGRMVVSTEEAYDEGSGRADAAAKYLDAARKARRAAAAVTQLVAMKMERANAIQFAEVRKHLEFAKSVPAEALKGLGLQGASELADAGETSGAKNGNRPPKPGSREVRPTPRPGGRTLP